MIASPHVGLEPPADQVLRRIAERAEEEEVEDDDRDQRRDCDRDPPCDEPPAHSSVHSSGSVLLRPLPMNDEPRMASEISTEPISTERGVVSQPSSVAVLAADGRAGRPRWPARARA